MIHINIYLHVTCWQSFVVCIYIAFYVMSSWCACAYMYIYIFIYIHIYIYIYIYITGSWWWESTPITNGFPHKEQVIWSFEIFSSHQPEESIEQTVRLVTVLGNNTNQKSLSDILDFNHVYRKQSQIIFRHVGLSDIGVIACNLRHYDAHVTSLYQ